MNDEITVDGYFRAGTSRAADFLPEAADGAIGCAACGRAIVKCFVLSDDRIVGGDCAATITGDDSTRQRGEDLFKLGARKPADLAVDEITFAEEIYRIRKARRASKDLVTAFAAYRVADRSGSREALGAVQKKRIFDAAISLRLA